jgi:hypothetical protein
VVEKDCQQMRIAQGGSDAPRSVGLSWHFALAMVPKVTRWTEAQRARKLAARFVYRPLAAIRQSQPTPEPHKAVRDGRTKRRARGCGPVCARAGLCCANTHAPRPARPPRTHMHIRRRQVGNTHCKETAQKSARSGYSAHARRAGTQPPAGRDSPKDMMLPSMFTGRPAAVPGVRRNRCLRAGESRLWVGRVDARKDALVLSLSWNRPSALFARTCATCSRLRSSSPGPLEFECEMVKDCRRFLALEDITTRTLQRSRLRR